MLKKAIFAGAAVVALGAFFLGRDLASYVATSASRMKASVRDSVPVEFEIERARKLVHDLVPEIRKNMHLVAKEEFEVERLGRQIEDAESKLARDQQDILRLRNDLTSGNTTYLYAGRTYNVQQVKLDLANRFERYKTQDATLASLREMHRVRQQSLDAARQKLESMLVAKRQLAVEVENLQARLKMVEARQATSAYSFDDSQLSRAKDLVNELSSRLAVAEKLVNSEGALGDAIDLDETAPDDIVEQVTSYFDESDADGRAIAETSVTGPAEAPDRTL